MRIIILVDNLHNGGAGRVASVLANCLCENHEVHVVAKESGIKYPIKNGVGFHAFDVNFRFAKTEVLFRLIHYLRLIRKICPDVIISLGYVSKYTALAKAFTGKVHFKTIDSERSDPNQVPSANFMRWLRDYLYGKSDLLVCQTYQAEQYFRRRIKVKTVVIPNPITPNLPYWNGMNSHDIVAPCRLDEQKNIPMLIDAFERIHGIYPRYRLLIYGKGPLEHKLKELIMRKHLGNCVELRGFTTNLHDILSKSFMFVSSSDHEGLSNSMLEALAIGIPVVCTDCPIGGASMFIKDKENGMLAPVKDTRRFFEAIKYLIEHKELLPSMSAHAVKIRQSLDAETIAGLWMKTIDGL